MSQMDLAHILKKARALNLDPTIYGTFAEIGAGQEIARHFFQAGRASQTIAKTISAYDMTFSDSIYGKAHRYVCAERVEQMLDHEFELLNERLAPQRGSTTRFFAIADTVATNSHDEPTSRCHGWMGIRFQTEPGSKPNTIVLHVQMLDRQRLQQQEALGILGVNLLHLAFNLPEEPLDFIAALVDSLGQDRIQINSLSLEGFGLSHLDARLISLQMVRQGLTQAMIFSPTGEMVNPSDVLFQKPVVLHRGTFRPVTSRNLQLLTQGLKNAEQWIDSKEPAIGLFELTMSSLHDEGQLNESDFLDRIDTMRLLGHHVLLSNFDLFYQVKSYLRHFTSQFIGIMVGASHLERLLDAKYYEKLPGGVLEGFARLFDKNTKIMVFPFKSDILCQTAGTFSTDRPLNHIYRYLFESELIVDILGCDHVDSSVHSSTVRQMLSEGNPLWEKMVPADVAKVIHERHLFGFKEKK